MLLMFIKNCAQIVSVKRLRERVIALFVTNVSQDLIIIALGLTIVLALETIIGF